MLLVHNNFDDGRIPMTNSVDYIYEDKDLLVCHKPAGMATEGAKINTIDVVSYARNYLKRKARANGRAESKQVYLATVHRLDQPVEGVLVLAKTKKAAGSITSQIKERTTEKYYYALCYGTFEEKKGHLTNYVIKRMDNYLAMVLTDKERNSCDAKMGKVTLESGETVGIISGEPKKAELEYEVVAEDAGKSLLRIKLLTGRFHQIRVQLAYAGHPILGENKYGSKESIAFSQECGIKDMCLVSYKFVLDHPSSGKRMGFEIEPQNEAIQKMLKTL